MPSERTHPCPAPRCEIEVKNHLLACSRHWYALPAWLRADIWNEYEPGQTAATMSEGYGEALTAAREVWAAGPEKEEA